MIVLLALLSLMFVGICSLALFVWVLREHKDAKKYRHLVALAERMPKATNKGGPQWSVTYKEGRKHQTVIVDGKTESEAMASFVKSHGARFDSILSLEKL